MKFLSLLASNNIKKQKQQRQQKNKPYQTRVSFNLT